jgi:hypothetical protein
MDQVHWESAQVFLWSVFEADHGPQSLRKCTSLSLIYILSGPRTTLTEKVNKFIFDLFSERTTDHIHWETAQVYLWSVFPNGPRTTFTEKVHKFFFDLFSERTTDHSYRESAQVYLWSVFRADHGPQLQRRGTSLSLICFQIRPRTTVTEKGHKFIFHLFSGRTTDHSYRESAQVYLWSVFWADYGPQLQRKCTSIFLICFPSRPRTSLTEARCLWSRFYFLYNFTMGLTAVI